MDKFRSFIAKTLVILGIIMMIVGVFSIFFGSMGWWANAETGFIEVSWLSALSETTWANFGWWMIAIGALAIVTGYLIDAEAAGEVMDRVSEAASGAAKGAGKVVWSTLSALTSAVPGWVWLAVGVGVLFMLSGSGKSTDRVEIVTKDRLPADTPTKYEEER